MLSYRQPAHFVKVERIDTPKSTVPVGRSSAFRRDGHVASTSMAEN